MLSSRVVDGSETTVKQRRQRVQQLKTTSLSASQDWALVHLAHKGERETSICVSRVYADLNCIFISAKFEPKEAKGITDEEQFGIQYV